MVPSLSTLKNKGIKIEEHPGDITQLPPYANDLRKLLLNFKEIVPINRKADLELLYDRDKDKHILSEGSRLTDAIYCDSGHRTYQARWDAAFKLRDKAKALQSRDRESVWNGLMSNFVFDDISSQASDQGILLRDLLCWGSDDLFTNAVDIRGRFSHNREHKPKPDFWFGLGLYHEEQLDRLKGLEIKDKGIEYFVQKNLEDVSTARTEKLIYQPVGSRKYAAFPWMVVELKSEVGDEKECIRQAANASHTSLLLCERLAARATTDPLPIVAFTSVGPKAKIFIAYKAKIDANDELYRIACIWSGNVEHILHALQLRRIVDQLMYWALRVFKPWVTECLEHWYAEDTEDESEESSDDDTEEGTEDETEEGTEDEAD